MPVGFLFLTLSSPSLALADAGLRSTPSGGESPAAPLESVSSSSESAVSSASSDSSFLENIKPVGFLARQLPLGAFCDEDSSCGENFSLESLLVSLCSLSLGSTGKACVLPSSNSTFLPLRTDAADEECSRGLLLPPALAGRTPSTPSPC